MCIGNEIIPIKFRSKYFSYAPMVFYMKAGQEFGGYSKLENEWRQFIFFKINFYLRERYRGTVGDGKRVLSRLHAKRRAQQGA